MLQRANEYGEEYMFSSPAFPKLNNSCEDNSGPRSTCHNKQPIIKYI